MILCEIWLFSSRTLRQHLFSLTPKPPRFTFAQSSLDALLPGGLRFRQHRHSFGNSRQPDRTTASDSTSRSWRRAKHRCPTNGIKFTGIL